MEAAWRVLKAPTEGYDSNLTDEENTDGRHTERQPQQPTITDFMGYTRPQLEQMIVMFQNELVRRGHPSGEPEVNIPNRDDYMTGTGMSSDAPPESVTDEENARIRQRIEDGTATMDDIFAYRPMDSQPVAPSSITEALAAGVPWEHIHGSHYGEVPEAHAMAIPDEGIQGILVQRGIDPSVIEPQHIHQYRNFMQTHGRHPTIEEINMIAGG